MIKKSLTPPQVLAITLFVLSCFAVLPAGVLIRLGGDHSA